MVFSLFVFSTTVGASDISDAAAYFTNYGKCVEIVGPVSD